MDRKHGENKCNVCGKTFWRIDQRNEHMQSCHITISIRCKDCDFTSGKLSILMKHKAENHKIKCDQCESRMATEKALDDHKKEMHAQSKPVPIRCDQCQWSVSTEEEMEQHKNQVHAQNKADNSNGDNNPQDESDSGSGEVPNNDLERELVALRHELKFVKNRFDQVLESHNDIEKEMDDMKKNYEEELVKVRNEFIKVKAEKEHFRVRNDLLQNMSKIIVEKCLNSKVTDPEKNETADQKKAPIEDDDIGIFMERMKKNKEQGYRRVSPSEQSAKLKEQAKHTRNTSDNKTARNVEEPLNHEEVEDAIPLSEENEQFCHFFNNYKKCTFEQNTGKKCKFVHRPAPYCEYGDQCSRTKCMYRHKKQTGGRDRDGERFLGQMNSFNPYMIPNWGMNPWVHQFNKNRRPNPWMSTDRN